MTNGELGGVLESLVKANQNLLKRIEAIESVITNVADIQAHSEGRSRADEILVDQMLKFICAKLNGAVIELQEDFKGVSEMAIALNEVAPSSVRSFRSRCDQIDERFRLILFLKKEV
jgi:hypothetical protein